ncbi:5' nucleotidase, NT5C type [Pleomorphovibrio marinus]|uniref:5' nucleotidase, NT5C type n=1 Tax=Pleomorphovibrio marinus TaxID=2164132 RepID=UPI000E09E2B4|nr:5'(3')-deoxyribonucleotidase [Pleomorphovibrio marinus]
MLSTKQRIAVDMDGVLADVYAQFLRMHEEDTGQKLSREQVKGLLEEEAFPLHDEHVNRPGFFRTAPVMQEAPKVLELLNTHFEVFIVSAAMEYPNSLKEKHDWLNAFFPFITWQQMVLCGSKSIIRADIMIDDHFKNLDNFQGRTLLFTQPHNQTSPTKNHQRVDNWENIAELLL